MVRRNERVVQVVRSPQLEPLLDALATALREDPIADAMRLECVAVPSRGAERWLSQGEPGRRPDRWRARAGGGALAARAVATPLRAPR